MDRKSTADELFARCADRRLRIADELEGLTPEQLATPSLCEGWTVRTVAAHLAVPLVTSPLRVGLTVARHGGSFPRANDALARALAQQPPAQLASLLRRHARSRFAPPLHGPAAPLTDLVIHTADLRIPLGRSDDITVEDAAIAFDLLTGSSLFFIPRGLLRGIQIAPTDSDRVWGAGARLTGSSADLLLAVAGRHGFLERVDGPARPTLAHRQGRDTAGA